MRLVLFLVALVACLRPCSVGAAKCERSEDGDYYRREVLIADNTLGYGLAIDWKTNTILLSRRFSDKEKKFEAVAWNVGDESYRSLGPLPGDCMLTVDQTRSRAYAACENDTGRVGLYIYDRLPQQFERLSDFNEYILYLYFHDKLYYSDNVEHNLHTFVLGRSEPVEALKYRRVYSFVIDGFGNWVYVGDNGVCCQKPNDKKIVYVRDTDGLSSVTVDPQGVAYAYGGDTMVRIDCSSGRATKVFGFPDQCVLLRPDKDGNFLYFNASLSYSSTPKKNHLIRMKRCEL